MEMNASTTQINAPISHITDRDLKQFIELITALIPIAYIFRCTPNAPGIRLIVVLDQHRFQRNEETKNILAFLGLSQINIDIMCFHFGTINDLLQQGNLFFAKHCNHNHCLYQHNSKFELYELSENNLDTLKTSSSILPKNAFDKALNFFDGASSFFTQGEFHLAAFMLHQTCEQMLRMIIKLFNGKEFKSHQLVLLQETAGFYFPEIKNIFDVKRSRELKWLDLLQQAYIGARYDDDYKVEAKHLIFIQQKIASMLDKVNHENLLLED